MAVRCWKAEAVTGCQLHRQERGRSKTRGKSLIYNTCISHINGLSNGLWCSKCNMNSPLKDTSSEDVHLRENPNKGTHRHDK